MLYRLLRPLLFRLDPERAHAFVTTTLRAAAGAPLVAGILRALYAYQDPILAIACAGLRFSNPVGLAAGFDKRGELLAALALLGFGHIEIGTVTPRPQPGNPRPRLFRLPEDRALINRLGFNSPGMVAVAQRLRAYRSSTADRERVVVGVNIGKNRTTSLERAADDYLATFVALAPFADYVAINISSPNTPGLRQLHERAALEALLGELTALNRRLPQPRPLFLKVSPDEGPAQIEAVVHAGCAAGIAGFIATNTTLAREGLRSQLGHEAGGLSGGPLASRAQAVVAQIYRLTAGRVPIIGVGGMLNAQDAYARIRAGAWLVQLYTGLVYEGPGLVGVINRGLVQLLRRDGYRSLADAIGADQA
jgi:dihydroorotate dehydrogenase